MSLYYQKYVSLCKYAVPAKPHLKVIAAWLTLSIEFLVSSVLTEQKQTSVFQLQKNISSYVKKRSPVCRVCKCSGNECTQWHIPTSLLPVVTRTPCLPAPMCLRYMRHSPACAKSLTPSTPVRVGGIIFYPLEHGVFQTPTRVPFKSIGTNLPSRTM